MKLQEALDIEEFIKSESKAEGVAEEKLDITRNMLRKGANINFISECTGLTVDEVKELKI